MSNAEGPIQVTTTPSEETPAALMTASTALMTTSSHDRSTPSSSPEGFREDPPLTPERSCEEGVFGSAIYRNLGDRWAPVDEKMAAGYRLIEAQKKDIDRMTSRLGDIQNQLREKDNAVAQIYTMIERVSPILKQMSVLNTELTAEEEELKQELRKVKRLLGIKDTDTEERNGTPTQENASSHAKNAPFDSKATTVGAPVDGSQEAF